MLHVPAPPHRSFLQEISGRWREWRADPGGELLLATNVIGSTQLVVWDRHEHDDPELLWDVDGTLRVETPFGVITVPSGLNLWIPAGVPHEVVASVGTTLSCTWFSPEHCPVPWEEPSLIAVTPLLRGVLAHLDDPGLPAAERRHAEAFALDLLVPSPTICLPVRAPSSRGLRTVAERLLAEPGEQRPVAEWAALAHMSVRSFTRAWSRETGGSFARWRVRVRMQRAMRLLSDGHTAEAAGRAVGYQSPSAFTVAFTRAVGMTPGAYCTRDR